MTGVEVLAQQEVAVEHAYCWPAFLITAGIIVVVFAVAGIVLSIRDYDWTDLIACVFAGVFFWSCYGRTARHSIPNSNGLQNTI